MNVTQNVQYSVMLCFTFLMVLIISCSTQNQSNQDTQNTEVNDNDESVDGKIDATLSLSDNQTACGTAK